MNKIIIYAIIISLPFYLYGCSSNPSSSHKNNGKLDNELPDIEIIKVSQLEDDMAIIKGKVLAEGGSTLQKVGLCWDTTGTPTVKSGMHKEASQVTVGSVFSVTMSNLKSNTAYHMRAYAKNKAGTVYSKMLNVITTNQVKLPQVKIVKPTFVSKKRVTIKSKLLNGVFKEVGLCWDKSVTVPTLTSSKCMKASAGAGNIFYATLSNLKNRTTYHVRAYAKNKAGIAYSDTLNVMTASNPIFGPKTYEKEGLTLIFKNNDPKLLLKCRKNVVKTFFVVYPEEKKRFNLQAAKTVTFVSDTSYHGVAATYWGRAETVFNANYFEKNCKDTDVATHEVMHIVQSYPQYKPVWLVEGIADYARYTFGVDSYVGGWSLPNYSPSQSYTDSYRVTARFLVWLENHVNSKIVDKLDASLRSKRYYKVNMWKNITGKTVDELWEEYAQNPSLN